MDKPRLLDLFCCSGGATRGYQNAGFHVTGVDIEPQPNYCGDDFIQADALDYLVGHGMNFDAIHASPPCQASTALTKGTNKGREYPQLIPATRALLAYYRVPTVIENVQGADIRKDVVLCGEMFGLSVIRHRLFEINNAVVPQPAHKPHRGRVAGYRHGTWYDGPYFAVYGDGGGKGSVAQWQQAMGIDWTNVRKEIAESIPPAYAEYIGRHLIQQLNHQQALPVLAGTNSAAPVDASRRLPGPNPNHNERIERKG
ncbi:DNA methylase [Gordonia alkanivorans]|uniref:DNA methylase n=1 Tax=Gordonia alkanivorans TaxID=84096 RepID=UPI0024B81E9F|nr:DNA methylase [Gordonia alkanivorans]MDJ0010122.1 DNA methylase [Gordonia alkanivorans]MDJ0495688.1 DNA methylase [Gordonia alkanivorans]